MQKHGRGQQASFVLSCCRKDLRAWKRFCMVAVDEARGNDTRLTPREAGSLHRHLDDDFSHQGRFPGGQAWHVGILGREDREHAGPDREKITAPFQDQ
jgi:hypothetical protein